MPGYDSQVIMAAGAFVSGSSIELSADGPMKPPYAAYFQGGLTYPPCQVRDYNVSSADGGKRACAAVMSDAGFLCRGNKKNLRKPS